MNIAPIGNASAINFETGIAHREKNAPAQTGDLINVKNPELLTDEEAESVLQDTMASVAQDHASALGVHSGLSQARVFELLGL